MPFKNAEILAKEEAAKAKKQENINSYHQYLHDLREISLDHNEKLAELRNQLLENIERVRLEEEDNESRLLQLIERLVMVKQYLTINETSIKEDLKAFTEEMKTIEATHLANNLGLTIGLVLCASTMGAGLFGAFQFAYFLHVMVAAGVLGGPVGLLLSAMILAIMMTAMGLLLASCYISQLPTNNVQALNSNIQEIREVVEAGLDDDQKAQLLDLKNTPVVSAQAVSAMGLISRKIEELACDADTAFARESADDKIVAFKELHRILDAESDNYLEIREKFND